MSAAPDRAPYQDEAAAVFLKTLFCDESAWIDVRHILEGDVRREPCHGRAAALAEIQRAAELARNVYVGVASRRNGLRGKRAGGKKNLRDVAALWVDVDHREEGDRELLEVTLESFPLPPSMRIWSGGGEHLYWLFDEPFALNQSENVQRFEQTLKGLADCLYGDRGATDAPRILRVPGTMNYPDERKRARDRTESECFMLKTDNGARYSLEDFADFETRGSELTGKGKPLEYESRAWNGELPKSVERLLQSNEGLRARWKGDTTGLDLSKAGEGADSELDMAIAERLAFEGVDGAEIEHALRFRRAETGGRKKHSTYFEITIEKARGWVAESKRNYAKKKAAATEPRPENATSPQESSALEDSTDDGNAERFLRQHGEDVRFVREWMRWLVWDGKRYCRDTPKHHRAGERMVRSLRSRFHEATEIEDEDKRGKILKAANRGRSMSSMRGALHFAERSPRVWIEPDQLDRDALLLNVSNGTIDLKTEKLHAHNRCNLITALAPIEWSPGAQCPKWLAFLKKVQPDAEMRGYLQRIAGYTLTADCSEDVTFIHYGRGANGKSTAIETVRAVLGADYSIELASSALMRRDYGGRELENLLAPLPGKRMATSLEPEEGQRFHEAGLKKLSSGEPVNGRFLYGEQFQFVPVCKLWMATNHRPAIGGDDEGIWRRIHLIPWKVEIPAQDRDPSLRRELFRDERAGILRWMVEGCRAWQRGGLKPPQTVLDATADYRTEQDTVGSFLAECCDIEPGLECRGGTLYKAFIWWCEQNGIARPESQRTFGDRLERRGFEKHKSNGIRRRGLNLRQPVFKALGL